MNNLAGHFFGKVAQKAIVVKDNKVLITKDVNEKVVWELPGGRLDETEKPMDGIKREIREELGVECEVKHIFYIDRMYHARDKQWMLVIYYIVELLSEDFKVDPVEVDEMQWVDKETWSNHEYFPEYVIALEKYFKE